MDARAGGGPEPGAEEPRGPPARRGRIRSPLIDDGQPAFRWWLPLPGAALALLWALWRGVTADADGGGGAAGVVLAQLLWPGPAIFAAAAAAAWLGWRIDLD